MRRAFRLQEMGVFLGQGREQSFKLLDRNFKKMVSFDRSPVFYAFVAVPRGCGLSIRPCLRAPGRAAVRAFRLECCA